jgi:hypothetical protein
VNGDITVSSGDTLLASAKRQKAAPGEMESIAVESAKIGGDIIVEVEEL